MEKKLVCFWLILGLLLLLWVIPSFCDKNDDIEPFYNVSYPWYAKRDYYSWRLYPRYYQFYGTPRWWRFKNWFYNVPYPYRRHL